MKIRQSVSCLILLPKFSLLCLHKFERPGKKRSTNLWHYISIFWWRAIIALINFSFIIWSNMVHNKTRQYLSFQFQLKFINLDLICTPWMPDRAIIIMKISRLNSAVVGIWYMTCYVTYTDHLPTTSYLFQHCAIHMARQREPSQFTRGLSISRAKWKFRT